MTAVKKVERPATPRSNRKNFFLCCNNFVNNNYKNNCNFSFTASLLGNSNSLSKIVSFEISPYVSKNKKEIATLDLVYFTRVPDTRKTSTTQGRHEKHE